MAKKGISQRKRLAAVFASFAILAVGTVSLCENMSLDYYTVLGTLQKVIPASFALGAIGWLMGMVLEKPKRSHQIGYNNMFLNNVIKNEISAQEDASFDEAKPEIQP